MGGKFFNKLPLALKSQMKNKSFGPELKKILIQMEPYTVNEFLEY